MQNIYYQSDWTLEYRFLGYIRNPETDLCWDTKSLKFSSKVNQRDVSTNFVDLIKTGNSLQYSWFWLIKFCN